MDIVYIKIIKISSVRCHFRPIFQGLKNGRFLAVFRAAFLGLILGPIFGPFFRTDF